MFAGGCRALSADLTLSAVFAVITIGCLVVLALLLRGLRPGDAARTA